MQRTQPNKENPSHGTCNSTGWETEKNKNNSIIFGNQEKKMKLIILQNTGLRYTIDKQEIDMFKTSWTERVCYSDIPSLVPTRYNIPDDVNIIHDSVTSD